MVKYAPISLAFGLALLVACIERIDLATPDYVRKLVVEASVTTQHQPLTVKLSENAPYSSNPDLFKQGIPVKNAIVKVYDMTLNTSTGFQQTSDGKYSSTDSSFYGLVGNTYLLEIIIGENTYHSEEVTIRPVAAIDSVYYSFLPETNTVGVFVDTWDLPEKGDAYKWSWKGYYKILTSLPGPPLYPDTFDCCVTCFMPVQGFDVNLMSDTYINGNKIERKQVAEIPMDDVSDFLVEIEQQSLTEEAYEFWNKLLLQRQSKGGLFDPLPFNIPGNIYNINNRDEIILGFFTATAVAEKHVMVKRREFSNQPFKVISQKDCRDIPFAREKVPDNWN